MYVLNKKDMEIDNTVYMNLFNIEFFCSVFFFFTYLMTLDWRKDV